MDRLEGRREDGEAGGQEAGGRRDGRSGEGRREDAEGADREGIGQSGNPVKGKRKAAVCSCTALSPSLSGACSTLPVTLSLHHLS